MLLEVIFLVTVLCGCSCSKILAIIPTPSYSHQVVFYPLWKELSLRGHHVTCRTTDPINNATLTNLTELDMSFVYQFWKPRWKIITNTQDSLAGFMSKALELQDNMSSAQLEHPAVQRLITDQHEGFDLVIVEMLHPIMFAFAERFECPLILVCSMDAPNRVHWTIGNPSHPAINPDLVLGYTLPLTFMERLRSTVLDIYSRFLIAFVNYPRQETVIKLYFGKAFPPLSEISKRIALIFTNTNPIFSHRPQIPSVIQIGGGTHLTLQKGLPKHLKDILDGAECGVIYFSLGTNFNTSTLNSKTLNILLETFSELAPIQVLWKYDADVLMGTPKNVYISPWFPQQAVLSHPNIKAFITQAGLQSVEEATYNLVPMICIPLFGDQFKNANGVVEHGMGVLLNMETMTKSKLKAAVDEVIQTSKYRDRMKELVELVQDQPMTGLERAIWWVEYVLRHKGAKHLQSPYRDIPLYQYLLLDVFAFCLIVLLLLLCVLYYSLKLLFKLVKLCLTHRSNKVKLQ